MRLFSSSLFAFTFAVLWPVALLLIAVFCAWLERRTLLPPEAEAARRRSRRRLFIFRRQVGADPTPPPSFRHPAPETPPAPRPSQPVPAPARTASRPSPAPAAEQQSARERRPAAQPAPAAAPPPPRPAGPPAVPPVDMLGGSDEVFGRYRPLSGGAPPAPGDGTAHRDGSPRGRGTAASHPAPPARHPQRP